MPVSATRGGFSTPAAGAGAANIPGTPVYKGNAANTIYIGFDENGNGDNVEYCIYVDEDDGSDYWYAESDGGKPDNPPGSEVWQTYSTWMTDDITAISGLTSQTKYKFKVKARTEGGNETEYSPFSGYFMPGIELAYSALSTATTLEIVKGNTKISDLTLTGNSGIVALDFTLTNVDSDDSRVEIEYRKTASGDYSGITELFQIKENHETINFSER